MNLQQATLSVLDWVQRSSATAGMEQRARDCVADAVEHANRAHQFKWAESSVNFEYPANTFSVQLSSIYAPTAPSAQGDPPAVQNYPVLSLKTAQIVADCNTQEGHLLEIGNHSDIIASKWRRQSVLSPQSIVEPSNGQLVSSTRRYQLFLLGQQFGLYPTPAVNVPLFVTYNSMLPRLKESTDTNFFLETGAHYIIMQAAFFMKAYIKDGAQVQVDASMVKDAWDAFVAWDNAIVNDHSNF